MVNTPQFDFQFVPMSTDERTIRFFGTLMPALLLIKESPGRFARYQLARRTTPRVEIPAYIAAETDDAGSVPVARGEDVLVFVHRWHSRDFDAFAFARAKTFLARVTRLVRRAGHSAESLDPLSPSTNLPRLAARAGLGKLSPFGLLVHPTFGPRLILSGLRTDYALNLSSRWSGEGCSDCLACVKCCPQGPLQSGVVALRLCQSCTECLAVCPVGKRT